MHILLIHFGMYTATEGKTMSIPAILLICSILFSCARSEVENLSDQGGKAAAAKDYNVAIAFYSKALEKTGLAPDVKKRLLFERGKAYLLAKAYDSYLADLNAILSIDANSDELIGAETVSTRVTY